MDRPRSIAVVLVVAGALGVLVWWSPPRAPTPVGCPDGGRPGLNQEGVLDCGGARPLSAGAALTVGQRFDCNAASEADFALVLGPELARRIVEGRGDGYPGWEALDAVPGLGPERLLKLQAACEFRSADGGVW